MNLQYQLSNGKWTSFGGDVARILADVIKRDGKWLPGSEKRQGFQTTDDVIAALESGKTLPYDTDWYTNIRLQPETTPAAPKAVETITCDCGHTIPRIEAKYASLGTACIDCYDRMSGE